MMKEYERDMKIALYRGERLNLRKLGKLAWSFIKERSVNFLHRMNFIANKSQKKG